MICNTKCNYCDNLIYTGGVTSTATNLIITLPSQNMYNNEGLCFLVTSSFPTLTTPLPVIITVGNTEYKMINKCGNYVYSDQLKTRRIYSIYLKTDSLLAVNGKYNLCPTSVDIPYLPSTTPPVPTAVVRRGEEK